MIMKSEKASTGWWSRYLISVDDKVIDSIGTLFCKFATKLFKFKTLDHNLQKQKKRIRHTIRIWGNGVGEDDNLNKSVGS